MWHDRGRKDRDADVRETLMVRSRGVPEPCRTKTSLRAASFEHGAFAQLLLRMRGHGQLTSHNPALALAPVAVAQEALVELAGRQPWQFGLEVDRARHLLARQLF